MIGVRAPQDVDVLAVLDLWSPRSRPKVTNFWDTKQGSQDGNMESKIQNGKDFDVLRRPDWSIDFKSKEKVRFNKIPSFVTPVEWGFNLILALWLVQSIMLSAAFYTSVKSYDPYDFLWGTCVIWAKKNYLKAMNFDVKTKFCVKHRDLFVKCTEMNLWFMILFQMCSFVHSTIKSRDSCLSACVRLIF